MSAADTYAACVDAVLGQRTRLRGPEPPGDVFAGLPPDHPVLKSDPRRQLKANARRADISNVRAVQSGWLEAGPPRGTFALINQVTYLLRDIVPFVAKLVAAATRRVLMTVNIPPSV